MEEMLEWEGTEPQQHMVTVLTSDGIEMCLNRDSLEQCSLFFRTLFNSNFLDSRSQTIILSTVSSSEMEECLTLMRLLHEHSLPNISVQTACSILNTASYLSMDEIIDGVTSAIFASLDPYKIIDVYRFVERRSISLASKIWNMIVRDFDKIYTCGAYLNLTREEMERALMNECLGVNSGQESAVVRGWAAGHSINEAARISSFADEKMVQAAEDYSGHFVFRSRIPNRIVISLGGWSPNGPTNVIEFYSTRQNRWAMAPPNLQEHVRSYHGMVLLGQKIYVFGGFNGVEYFPHTKVLDMETLTWKSLSCMREYRCYVSSAPLGDSHLMAIGGFDGMSRLKSCEVYDSNADQWTKVAQLHKSRSDACAVRLGDSVYTIGGFDGQEIHNTMEWYSVQDDQWYFYNRPMLTQRTGPAAVSLTENVVFVLGGFNGSTRLRSTEFLDVREGNWHRAGEMLTHRSHCGAALLGEELIAGGGFDGNRTTNKSEKFEMRANRWQELTPMGESKSALRMLVIDNPNFIRATLAMQAH